MNSTKVRNLLLAAIMTVGMLGAGTPAIAQFGYFGAIPSGGCNGPQLGLTTTGALYDCPSNGGSATWTWSMQLNGIQATNTLTDGYFTVGPGNCAWASSGGTVTSNGPAVSGNIVVSEIDTTTATETATLICAITIPTKLTAGHGVTVNNLVLRYGNSTGTIATCGAPTVGTQAAPTPGTSETAASATLTTAGAVTVTPVVGSCNGTAVSAGQIYSEKIALTTPTVFNTDLTTLYFTQSFVGPTTASFSIYAAGIDVHYTNMPI